MDVRIGRGVGLLIEQALRSAKKRIIVVSPWISEEYALLLRQKAESGVDVRLVVSRPSESEGALKHLMRWNLRPEYAVLLLLALFILTASLLSSLIIPALMGGVLLLLSLFLILHRSPAVDLRTPEPFIHAKVYVADGRAYLSSANLTRAGLHENVEFVVEVDDPQLVERIVRDLEALG